VGELACREVLGEVTSQYAWRRFQDCWALLCCSVLPAAHLVPREGVQHVSNRCAQEEQHGGCHDAAEQLVVEAAGGPGVVAGQHHM
jgi:hypothetical protein